MSDSLTPADENLEPLFALSDIADPAVFLAGTVIPLAPRPALSMPPTNAYFWCRDHLIISDSEEGAAMRINSADVDIFDVLMVNLSDPDVAQWVDRKIASRITRHPFLWAAMVITDGFFEVVWGAGHVIGQCGVDHMVDSGVARNAKHLPTTRAAVLRSMFGSANV